MKYTLASFVALLLSVNGQLFTSNESHQKYMWEQFKQEWTKSYDTETAEVNAFGAFVKNLKLADERNAAERASNGTATHGITKFFDLSQEDFAARYLTTDVKHKTEDAPLSDYRGEPSAVMSLVDWTGKYTTPVKDQGYCGSCWAFSATEQIESDLMRLKGQNFVLSPEQITQCDTTSSGCNGGWPSNGISYVKKAGGIETNSDYPYTSYQGTTGKCSANSAKFVASVTGYATVSGESTMASYVQSKGPLSICIDASTWSSYTGGIVTTCGHSINHAVQAVGIDTSAGYWKVRNSWGTSWGESGYIRLKYNANTCGITYSPVYATV